MECDKLDTLPVPLFDSNIEDSCAPEEISMKGLEIRESGRQANEMRSENVQD
jgi:hypothetical protein